LKTTGKDLATIAAETSKWFAERWRVVDSRMEVIPGKACLAAFCKKVQDESGISLQPSRIVEAIPPTEIPDDLQVLILLLEKLRTASPAEEQVDKTTAQDWHGRAEKIRT